jgi:fatty acid synthase subunit beta
MYGTPGSTTGVSTPHSASSLRPLVLNHGSLEHALLVPTAVHYHASELRLRFLSTLPVATEELALDDEPSSVPELVARFLGYVADQVVQGEDDASGTYEDVLRLVLTEFEGRFLRGNEVHAVATQLPGIPSKRLDVIRYYYAARQTANRPPKPHESALFRAAAEKNAGVYAIFGGQGNIEEYFDELRELYGLYEGLIEEFVVSCAQVLSTLARDPKAGKVYSKGLDVMRWLQSRESTPDLTYLVSAPVSLPLIGLVQLSHYFVVCKILGKQPGDLRSKISGATGHSQGIVTAAAISLATSWESFYEVSRETLTMLFWIGCRSQQTYPRTSLAPSTLQDSISEGEGNPSPMLSIRDLTLSQVQRHVEATNTHLPEDRHIHISLINGPRNVVVTGPPQSLHGLNLTLRKVKAPTGLDQTRVPYTERKQRFTNRFLPISAPFHSPYLESAAPIIEEDCKDIKTFAKANLGIPVYDTHTGENLQQSAAAASIVPELIRLITSLQVHWEKATVFKDATHILDFGPGGVSGIGALTHRNKDGKGVRVILAGAVEGTNNELGYKPELFDRDEEHAVKYAVNWVKEHGPKLVKTRSGATLVDTKFSRLLGRAPLMVAGMTPATVPWDFVSATMNAGYHIELGGGGYYNARGMTEALRKIEENTIPGAGITVNLIYVNPRAMAWQVPLVQQLRASGVPIEGMTIGAGVPSLEVANEYIQTLGLKHISFKPGSMDAIQQVINIAKANPTFPVILQWTGGRGGGHHSFEDFHQPILQMYGRIRRCENIVLVAGSGFGGAEDTYPYLTGSWSEKYQYPPMPFDGVLFASRMMVAEEAHTSRNVSRKFPVTRLNAWLTLLRPRKPFAKLKVLTTRTGRGHTRDPPVVSSRSVLKWVNPSTRLLPVAFNSGLSLIARSSHSTRLNVWSS